MMEFFGIAAPALFGQLLLGLINGAFYALLSLGLAVIFGMLNVINFAHGAQYMMGAFGAWMLLNWLGVGFWPALVIVPLLVGLIGMAVERVLLRRLAQRDHIYGLLVTLGLAMVVEGLYRKGFGVSGQPYPNPLPGGINLGFMFLPWYRGFVVIAALLVCLGVWYAIERTRLGMRLRAATENPNLVRALGIDVPRLVMLTYGAGVALAALAGVMAAPVFQVSPLMGSHLIIVVFAVVVIGGMGSILGAIITGFGLGLVEGLTKVYGVDVLIGENTRDLLPGWTCREVDRVRFKGKDRSAAIFEPLGLTSDLSAALLDEIAQWDMALAVYRARDWPQAADRLDALHEAHPTRGLYSLFAQRVAQFQQTPPAENWDGSTKFDVK